MLFYTKPPSSIHYHSINILFHRPSISKQASGETAENQTEVPCQHLVECTKSAETLTSILKWIEKYHSLVSEGQLQT